MKFLISINCLICDYWFFFLFLTVKGAPRNLIVSDETTDSFKVGWSPAPGNVLRYRIDYRPVAGGERKEVTVPGNERATTLQRLLSDTKYHVSVTPEYNSGPGKALKGNGATEESMLFLLYYILSVIHFCNSHF